MASRVNTRFVILLVGGVVGLLGLLLVAYTVAFKSAADNIREGDRLLAEGNVKLAERAYSKAVNKESTNTEYLDKWVNSLEMLVPETETEYRDRFFGDYSGSISKKATVLRNDVDAHERVLKIYFEQLMGAYSRGMADRLIEQTTSVLGFFSGGIGDEVQPWETLKRYRGIAITQIAQNNGVLDEDRINLGIDDLERAVKANPLDAHALTSLMSLKYAAVDRDTPSDQQEKRLRALRENLQLADEYLAQYPNSARVRLQKLMLEADISRRALSPSLSNEEVMEAMRAPLEEFKERLDVISQDLYNSDNSDLDLRTCISFAAVENALSRESRLSRSRRLLDKLLENDRENAELLFYAGTFAERAGDMQEASAWFEQISELEIKPLSYAGYRQFFIQRLALVNRCGIYLTDHDNALTDEEREAALANAKRLRDEYSAVVSGEDLSQLMLNGRIARAEGQFDEALRIFRRYNEQTQKNSADGLWYEGMVASELAQYGIARDAFELLVVMDDSPRQVPAMLMLAQLHEQLQDIQTSVRYYQQVLELRPDIEAAKTQLNRLELQLNPELNEDPALAAIYGARKIRMGDDESPGDYAAAIEYLREQVIELDYESRVTRELASLLLDRNDIDGARSILTSSAQNNPDDEGLQLMLNALDAGDQTSILIQLVMDSPGSELDRYLQVANIAAGRGRPDVLQDMVGRLNEIAPDDKRVLELTFVNALRNGNIDVAKQISEHPSNTRVEKLAQQARIALAEENTDRASDLLRQAVATGAADATTFQMLAVIQRNAGQTAEAVESFERSLAIRPDNDDVIFEYILTLASARQYEEALNEARRYQRYATSNDEFMSLWFNLEAQFGGPQGRSFATRQRERVLELNPDNTDNTFQLARLYMLDRNWDASRALIDSLVAKDNSLANAELEATWYAEQGIIDGRDGLQLANDVFKKYIESLPEPIDSEPFIRSSQFMLTRGRPDLAVAAATEAVKHQSPETMEGTILLGDLNMRISNFTDAVRAYTEVVEAGADSDDFAVHARLVDVLVRLERFEEANEVYSKLPESKSNEIITMLQGADIAFGMGDTARAQQILDNAVSAYPNDPIVYIKRAEQMIGDASLSNDMLSDLNRAIEIEPNNWRAYRVRAAGYFALNQREEALNDLRETIRINPALDRSIYSVLNELLSISGRAGEAADVAREVLSQRSDDANLMTRIGGMFAARDEWDYASEFYNMAWDKRRAPSDGATLIDTLVRQTPPNINAANNIINELAALVGDINSNSGLLAAQALVLQARGREDFAQQQITKAFDLSANNTAQLLNWANNLSRYFEDRDVQEQITYLETLKRRNSNQVIGHWLDYFIAQRLLRESDISEDAFLMISSLQAADIPDGISLRAYRLHGSSLFGQNNFTEAAAIWQAGLGRFPDDWEMNNNLAYTLGNKLDKPQEALAYGEKAISQNIQMSEPYETMASIYIALDRFDEAQQMIDSGSRFINSIPARVTMTLTTGRLALKQGNLADARSTITDSRAVLRAAPEAYPTLDSDIDAFEEEVNSAEN